MAAGDAAGDGGPLAVVVDAFAGIEGRAAVGELDDHRRSQIARRFQGSIDGIGAGAVDGRKGKAMLFRICKDLLYILAGDDPCRD